MGLHFRQRRAGGIKVLVFAVLSLALMFLDYRYDALIHVRQTLSRFIVEPIQYAIDWPVRVSRWARMGMHSEHELLLENARLRAHQLLLKAKLHQRDSLAKENQQLRDLLKSSDRLHAKVKAAQVLAVSLDPNLNQLVISAGKQDQVFVGQPILDAYGVLGQVIAVGATTSRVLLLSDRRNAVPVESTRANFRTLAKGSGVASELVLMYVPLTADVKEGDLFVTSGLALRYPEGYPVGHVTKILRKRGDHYMTVVMTPTAKTYQARQVLLAWPVHASLDHGVSKQLKQPLGGAS